MKVSPAVNEVNLGFHHVRARWNPGFIRFRPVRSMQGAVLVVPAWLKSCFWGPRRLPRPVTLAGIELWPRRGRRCATAREGQARPARPGGQQADAPSTSIRPRDRSTPPVNLTPGSRRACWT